MEQTDDKRIRLLRDEVPAKAIVRLGVPLIAGMFIMILYNLTDTYFIGLMKDDYQLAAVNLAYPIMMISVAVSNMVGSGAASLIARSLGAGDREKADHTVLAAFLLTVLKSLLVTLAGMVFLPQIVRGLGAKENTFDFTSQYAQIILLGSIFTMGSYTIGQLLRSEGSVKMSIVGMIAGTLTNIALDPLFIFTLHLRIRGAAIAQKILSLGTYVYQGFAAGTQPIMGYNYGAKNFTRMLDVLESGVLIVSGTEGVIMLICGIFAPFWIGIFADNPETVAIGTRSLRALMWILPFVGAVSMSRMSFQAMGKPQYAFAITLVRQLILYIPLLLILDHCFGFSGMIWAQPVTELLMMAASVSLLYLVIRKAQA